MAIDSSLFYSLSPAKLAKALGDAMGVDAVGANWSEEQKLYAKAVLLNVARVSAPILAEDNSLQAQSVVRMQSPAYSLGRVGKYEAALYDLVEQGKVDTIKSIIRPQTLTATTHPNFTRSRALAKKCQELTEAICDFHLKSQYAIQEKGALPSNKRNPEEYNASTKVRSILNEMKPLIAPREKRSRADELTETVLDFIPTVLSSAEKQIDIFKTRKSYLSGGEALSKGEQISLRSKFGFEGRKAYTKNKGSDEQALNKDQYGNFLDTKGAPSAWEFSNINQLDAVAAMMPHFNSWFADGDGKRTCHAYDAEYAVPAIKRVTYDEYLKILNKLPGAVGAWNVEATKRQLTQTIAVLQKVEDKAKARMDALNKLNDAFEHLNSSNMSERDKAKAEQILENARGNAHRPCDNYNAELSKPVNIEGMRENSATVSEWLPLDHIAALREPLKKALTDTYSDKKPIPSDQRKILEELYIKLTAYGNYAVRLQRRENATEYKTTFEYLLENSRSIQNILSKKLSENDEKVAPDQILQFMDNPGAYTHVAEKFAECAQTDQEFQAAMQAAFKAKANKLGKGRMDKNLKIPKWAQNGDHDVVFKPKPLERREFIAVDALGYFQMARLYPEAFDGFVTAEFGQPSLTTLQSNDSEKIKNEVIRQAKTDMLLQTAFAYGMEAPNVSLIPLNEDPATLKYGADAQEALRSGPIRTYLLHKLGIDDRNEAEAAKKAKAMAARYLDESGAPQLLTAYQDLKRYGCTDEELLQKKGYTQADIEKLKTTYVLDGPPDMEACSDNSKRATIVGAELAEQSVRDKAIEAYKPIRITGRAGADKGAKYHIELGGQSYVIRKPKYLGQGGAIARAAEIPLDTVQATTQGENTFNFVPQSLALKAYHYMLGRLFLGHEAARGETPSDTLYQLAAATPFHSGNALGLTGYGMDGNERAAMNHAIEERIRTTRDDERYDDFLAKYGEPTINNSARSDVKGTDKPTFNNKRAIGVANEEGGIFSNIIGVAAMFDKLKIGEALTELSGLDIVKKWKDKDYSIQQRLTAAGLIAHCVNVEEKWAKGDIAVIKGPEEYLEKTVGRKKVRASLKELAKAYTQTDAEGEKIRSYKPAGSDIAFDSADLVMAHLHSQYRQLEKGLLEIYPGKNNVLELFDAAQRPEINATKEIYDNILARFREAPLVDKDDKQAVKNNKLLAGAYHLLFESGGGIFPVTSLREEKLYAEAEKREKEAKRNTAVVGKA